MGGARHVAPDLVSPRQALARWHGWHAWHRVRAQHIEALRASSEGCARTLCHRCVAAVPLGALPSPSMPAKLLAPGQIKATTEPRRARRIRNRVSPRAEKAIHALVWLGMDRRDAAQYAGLTDHGLYTALRTPHIKAMLLREYEVLRTSERPRAFRQVVTLAHGATSEKVRLDASKYIDSGGKADHGVTVNVGVQVQPGYLVDASPYVQEAHQILNLAGSTRNVLTDQRNSAGVPVEDEGTP